MSLHIIKAAIKLVSSSNNHLLHRSVNNFRSYGATATISKDGENLVVKGDDALAERFPLVWLRDNCTCDECFHRASQARLINWVAFNVDVKVKSVQNGEGGVAIKWDDDHRSVFDLKWLSKRSFSKDKQQHYLGNVYMPAKTLWGREDFFNIMKTYEYHEVMTDDKQFYNWLMDLAVYGVVLIRNAPVDPKEGRKLANKIAFIRKTHYGEDFHVVAKDETNSVAYLPISLQLHTDLPFYDHKPGASLLHCVMQTEGKGGENSLTDVFYVAKKLRERDEESFNILTTTEVNWSDVGTEDGFEFNKIYRAPVISLDSQRNILKVTHSVSQRDSHFTVNLEDVKPWYKALRIFITELYENAAEFKMQPGDVLAFDNTRLVHGRTGYEDTPRKAKRFLVGQYVDWDEIYSRIRVLRNKLYEKY